MDIADSMITVDQFESAFATDFGRTIRFMRAKGCSVEDSEDLAQSAWALAWAKRDQFRGDSKLVTWVSSIALNLLRNEWRKPHYEHVGEGLLATMGVVVPIDRQIESEQILSRLDAKTAKHLRDYYMHGERSPALRMHALRAKRKARLQYRQRTVAQLRRVAA